MAQPFRVLQRDWTHHPSLQHGLVCAELPAESRLGMAVRSGVSGLARDNFHGQHHLPFCDHGEKDFPADQTYQTSPQEFERAPTEENEKQKRPKVQE